MSFPYATDSKTIEKMKCQNLSEKDYFVIVLRGKKELTWIRNKGNYFKM
jgi:hypothetical protein